MKNIKKYVSLVAAALMLATVVPAINVYADEDVIEEASVADVLASAGSITVEDLTNSSMKISWDDQGYENSNYRVEVYAQKSIYPQYGAADTHIKFVSNTNTLTLTNLLAEMPYKIYVYKQDATNALVAQGEVTTGDQEIVLSATDITKDSMKVSWNDQWYRKSRYRVEAYAQKSIYPQYGAADTHIEYVDCADNITLTNLKTEMPYKIFVYRQDTNKLIAQGEFSTADQEITITQDAADSNSMTLSWNDQWYRKYDYMVVAWSTKSVSPQYSGSDTHVETVRCTDKITLTNLLADMPYKVFVYRQDTVNKTSTLIAQGTYSTTK